MIDVGRQLDRVIGVFAPSWAMRRTAARATMAQIEQFSGSGGGGYEAGKKNRLNRGRGGGAITENTIPREMLAWTRQQAWDLYRNNPHARKICRTLESKVIGKGPRPISQAMRADGTPHVEFRARAQELWKLVVKSLDARGKPGQGGQHLSDWLRLSLRKVILSGEVLWRTIPLDEGRQKAESLPIPLLAQLIDPDRLATEPGQDIGDNTFYRGIELDGLQRRAYYHLYDFHPMEVATSRQNTRRVPAREIGHLYMSDDVDQFRGVSWFAPAIIQMRETGDYQYNELKASAMAACIVLGYRKASGQNRFGVENPNGDPTDANGNPITAIQPGMFINLGKDGDLQGFNPMRAGANTEGFISHMLRSTSTALPGVKSSTVTADYRNSSFSSERSADNDIWPEIEAVQEWFYSGMCQPLYEAVITAGILCGFFDGIITSGEFNARRESFIAADWQGPVARSINPVQDAIAAQRRIQNGQSSPQIEAAQIGRNWRELLKDFAEFREFVTQLGLPEEFANNIFGVGPDDVVPSTTKPAGKPDA